MNKASNFGMCIGIAGVLLVVGTSPLLAASTAQMKACKMAVLEKPQFHDFPMAAVSVRPGNKHNKVAFTVQWDGASGHGNCKVSPDGYVENVNVKQFHHGSGNDRYSDGNNGGSSHRDSGGYAEQDGFWRNDQGKWIDPDGEVCNSCTPDNGFPAAEGRHNSHPEDVDGFYYDRHTGQWRDPDGEVCHTCTPENGFPDQ